MRYATHGTFRFFLYCFAALDFLYCIILLLMMGLETRMVFPRGGFPRNPPEGVEPVWLTAADGVRLHAWYCPCRARNAPPADVRPVVLLFHGNAGDHTYRMRIATQLQIGLGADVFLFSYRGYGLSEGSPSEEGLYKDARAAWDYLTQAREIAAKRIILYGESLGTAVALELALAIDNQHQALILQGGFTSIPDAAQAQFPWLPVRWLARNQFASINRIGSHRRPLILVHGTADDVTPYAEARQLYEAAHGIKWILALADRGHVDVLDPAVVKAIFGRLSQIPLFERRPEKSAPLE